MARSAEVARDVAVVVADRGALDLEHDLRESRCHIGAGDRPQRRADRLGLLVVCLSFE